MSKRIKLWCFFSVMLILSCAIGVAIFAAEAPEASLKVTESDGTVSSFEGTYQAMHEKLVSLAADDTARTEYLLTLNKDAAYTKFKSITGCAETYVTVDLNGYTLDVSGVNSNIYMLAGGIKFTLDGADKNGVRGTVINHGRAGGIVFVQPKDVNIGTESTVKNVKMYYTNMAQGYDVADDPDKAEYPNQPMCHIGKGTLTLENVTMTYTGERATAVPGSEGSPEGDISKLSVSMVNTYSGEAVNITDCEFYDTNIKGIKTVAIDVSGSPVTLRGCVIDTGVAILAKSKTVANVYDSEISAGTALCDGAGKTFITDSVINCESGVMANTGGVTFAVTADGETRITSPQALSGTYAVQSGYELKRIEDGVYLVLPSTQGATLSVRGEGIAPEFYSGTYQEMHAKLADLLKIASTADKEYLLVLNSDGEYTKHLDLVTATAEGATASITLDLNGYTLTAHGMHNNLYTAIGTANGYLNITLDGANSFGERGKIICTDFAGGLFYTRANNGLNKNTVAIARDLEMYYTNMAAGYGNTNPANQPMMHLPAGKVYMKNIKMTYTGADATALEGKNLTDMVMPFVQCNGAELTVEDCEFIDTNDKGIKTRGFSISNGSNVTVKNTSVKAFYGIVCNNPDGGVSSVDVRDSKIEGTYCTYNGTGIIKVTDCESVTAANGKLTDTSASCLYFIYGNGKNTVRAGVEPLGSRTVQDGYTLSLTAEPGVYKMLADTSVEATLAISPYGAAPSFTKGSFDSIYASLNGVAPTVPTEYYISLSKDASYTKFKSLTLNSQVTLTVDLNGKSLNASVSANLFQIVGNYKLNIDGADAAGNRALVLSTGAAGAIVYPQNRDGLNDLTVIRIHDVDLKYTNLSQGYSNVSQWHNQPMANIPAGNVTYENVKVEYTGEQATAVDGSSQGSDISRMKTSFISASGASKVTVINCTFKDVNEKGITTTGISVSGSSSVKVINSSIYADNGIATESSVPLIMENVSVTAGNGVKASNAAARVSCVGGELCSDGVAFLGSGEITVADVNVYANGILSSESVKLLLLNGSGNTKIYMGNGAVLEGYYTVEDGYKICLVAPGEFIVSDGRGYSTIVLPAVFSDGMVFQRGKPITVFGYGSADGVRVKVTLDGKEKQAVVTDGRWSVSFDAMTARKGLTLTVEELETVLPNPINVSNIDVGEIWLIGGEGNADYELYKMQDAEEYILNADNYDNIRIYSAASASSPVELQGGNVGVWRTVDSSLLRADGETGGAVSAVAYVAATRLAIELDGNVTVAIMDVNSSDSSIKTWIEYGALSSEFGTESEDIRLIDAYRDFYLTYGRIPYSASELSVYIEDPSRELPTANYNAMLAYMNGFEIGGVIWMQGETDIALGENYARYYGALSESFRTLFRDGQLPIFVVQLAPFGEGGGDLQAAQYAMTASDPNSYLISAFNEGALLKENDLRYNTEKNGFAYSTVKSPIGHRLADAILKEAYELRQGETVSAPRVESVTADGNRVLLTFDTEIRTKLGTEAVGFEIAGEDGIFYAAVATVSENKIILECETVSEPKSVRYGYGSFIIQTKDGTVIEYSETVFGSLSEEGVTVTDIDGNRYVFSDNGLEAISVSYKGNVTNDSGYPLPIFKLAVGYTCEGVEEQ